MNSDICYPGGCFCGTVQIVVRGSALVSGYCHCTSCRRWSASPINAFTLWRPEAISITRGAETLASYNKTTSSFRRWCVRCGGHVLTEHPGVELTDVFAATIPSFPFQPEVHLHYQESVLKIKDGLPKLRDVPREMGGTGDIMTE